MRLYLVDRFFYPLLKPALNAVRLYPWFYGNRDAHVFFVKDSLFNAVPLKNATLKPQRRHLSWEGYSFSFPKNYPEQTKRIAQTSYDEIVFVAPPTFPWRFSVNVFLKYFKRPAKVLYVEDLRGEGLLERLKTLKGAFEASPDADVVKKAFVLKSLDILTYNFFVQKTPLRERVKLSTLFLENLFKGESKNVVLAETGGSEEFAYRLFGSSPFSVYDRYAWMEGYFADEFADPNGSDFFFSSKEASVVTFAKEKFFVKSSVPSAKLKSSSAPKMEEGFVLNPSWFTMDEIARELEDKIYEKAELDEDLRVRSYEGIPINFDAEAFVRRLLAIEDGEALFKELEDYPKRLAGTFDYSKFRKISKCPVCGLGNVYDSEKAYFCDSCDFKMLKKSPRYGITISKRLFHQLVKYKSAETYYEGEIKKVKLSKGREGWMNVIVY